ncbi:MAG: hypothetical protein HOG49_16745 [Candidatus Scalindua sp.]|jgi:hypothetical protein|nr:hypothetical protein [Candidatus Scalindua sp.]
MLINKEELIIGLKHSPIVLVQENHMFFIVREGEDLNIKSLQIEAPSMKDEMPLYFIFNKELGLIIQEIDEESINIVFTPTSIIVDSDTIIEGIPTHSQIKI